MKKNIINIICIAIIISVSIPQTKVVGGENPPLSIVDFVYRDSLDGGNIIDRLIPNGTIKGYLTLKNNTNKDLEATYIMMLKSFKNGYNTLEKIDFATKVIPAFETMVFEGFIALSENIDNLNLSTMVVDNLNNLKPYFPTTEFEVIKQSNREADYVLGAKDFITQEPVYNGVDVSVADFGASPQAKPEENATAFEQAIEKVEEINASKLIIPTGVYYLRTEKNNQIEIKGLNDLLIEGMGSELIFKDHENTRSGAFIRIENCERVKIHNLTLDWDFEETPLNFLGTVSHVDFDQNRVEFTIDGTKVPQQFTFDLGQQWDMEVNNKVPQPSYSFPSGDSIVSHEKVSDNKFSVTFTSSNTFAKVNAGDPVYLRFKSNYNANAINVYKGKDIILKEITVHSVPYQVCYMSVVENLEYNNVRVIPKEGRRFTGFGGLETHQVIKNVKLINSTLDGIYDDFMHISNGFFGLTNPKQDEYTVTFDNLQHYATVDYIYEGANFIMKTAEFEDIEWKSEIVDFQWELNVYPNSNSPHRCTVTFKDPLPLDYKSDNVFFNTDFFGGNVIIKNNDMKNGSCHGLYVGMSNVTIENNTFDNFAYPALIVNTVIRWQRWFIGMPIENVVIKNNHLKNNNSAMRDPASLFVGGGYDYSPTDYHPVKGHIVKNVLVENNVVQNSTQAAFAIHSAKNVFVTNNTFIDSNTKPSKEKYLFMGNVFITNVSNVLFAENTINNNTFAYENGMFVNNYTTDNIIVESDNVIGLEELVEGFYQQHHKFDDDGNLVVNVGDYGYSQPKGNWSESGYIEFPKGVPTRQSSSNGAVAQWKPMLKEGRYKVYIYKVVAANSDKQAQIEVGHKNGVYNTILDYSTGNSEYVYLGEFDFELGNLGYVLNKRTNNITRASTVKFVRVGSEDVSPAD